MSVADKQAQLTALEEANASLEAEIKNINIQKAYAEGRISSLQPQYESLMNTKNKLQPQVEQHDAILYEIEVRIEKIISEA